ncbi:MAG: OmpA family protein [Gammaproteobacteria bacterium]|jgi:outer membrane protein OmpA-like peptidoglycan-associated protein
MASALLASCAGPQTNPSLEQARTAVNNAQTNPQIAKYAPKPLEKAEQTLNRAETAWEEDRDTEYVSHLAYVTQQQVATAQARADERMAIQKRQQLSEERDVLMAKAGKWEAQAAQQQAEERVQELEQELADLRTKRTSRGIVVTLDSVLFEFNKATLKPGAQREISRLASVLTDHPDRNLIVEGHTDSVGSDNYNQRLSQQRAQSVKDALIRQGVNPNRITATGYGEAYPVASNNTAAGRQQNRRVEVIVLNAGEKASAHMRDNAGM